MSVSDLDLMIGSVYFGPEDDIVLVLDLLDRTLEGIIAKYPNDVILIGGDFNAWVAELNRHVDGIKTIHQFSTTDKTTNRKRPLPVFSLIADSNVNITQLRGVKTILHHTFRIENYRTNGQLPQWYRCQKFGHASYHCRHPIKCVRCAEDHNISNCPRSTDPKCANCGEGHVASFRMCPKRLEFINKNSRTTAPPKSALSGKSIYATPLATSPPPVRRDRSSPLSTRINKPSWPALPNVNKPSTPTPSTSTDTCPRPPRMQSTSATGSLSTKGKQSSSLDNLLASSPYYNTVNQTSMLVMEAASTIEEINKLNLFAIIDDLKAMVNEIKLASSPIEKIQIISRYAYLFDSDTASNGA